MLKKLDERLEKGTGPICAQHPPGRSGKLDLSPFQTLRPGQILDILAVLLRQSPEMLLSMTVHRFAQTLAFGGEQSQPASVCDLKTTLKYFAGGSSQSARPA